MHTQKDRPSRIKGWVMPLVGFLVAQLYFIACDRFSWNPNREINPGTIMGRIMNSKLFTEWFTPYDLPISNVITAFLIVTILLPALIGAVKVIFSTK
ncbi:hypothetical protein PAALTS15_28766 [Paenibacillus alvei TS-15]|jgi:YfzA-like protein|uniref:Uncharacterized protein n=1 Tax=Paenibacillus alvei TS-15 TaxID=1117108 RepID=S9SI76_PAEAL|nr:YfzA family protein [Paenibacillus alvei]EPY03813.1 hypothetical protein PAALTS15_28766 [Paenibacillus alvei TS-15]